jgi:hypothetical protein
MRSFLLIVFLALASSASAQVLGYAVMGAGGSPYNPAVAAAAGAEVFARPALAIAGEAGQIDALTTISASGVVHLPDHRGLAPFVSAGYTRLVHRRGNGDGNALSLGAGIDVRRSRHVGIRVELRDHIINQTFGPRHHWALRAGLVFR